MGLVETLGGGFIHSDALAGSCQSRSLFFVLVDSSAPRRRFRPARPGLGRSLTPVVWSLQGVFVSIIPIPVPWRCKVDRVPVHDPFVWLQLTPHGEKIKISGGRRSRDGKPAPVGIMARSDRAENMAIMATIMTIIAVLAITRSVMLKHYLAL